MPTAPPYAPGTIVPVLTILLIPFTSLANPIYCAQLNTALLKPLWASTSLVAINITCQAQSNGDNFSTANMQIDVTFSPFQGNFTDFISLISSTSIDVPLLSVLYTTGLPCAYIVAMGPSADPATNQTSSATQFFACSLFTAATQQQQRAAMQHVAGSIMTTSNIYQWHYLPSMCCSSPPPNPPFPPPAFPPLLPPPQSPPTAWPPGHPDDAPLIKYHASPALVAAITVPTIVGSLLVAVGVTWLLMRLRRKSILAEGAKYALTGGIKDGDLVTRPGSGGGGSGGGNPPNSGGGGPYGQPSVAVAVSAAYPTHMPGAYRDGKGVSRWAT